MVFVKANLADTEVIEESAEVELPEKVPQSLEKRTQLFTHF